MITKYIKGIDAMIKINDLPNNIKGDVRQGKYKLKEEDDLSVTWITNWRNSNMSTT